MCRIMHSPRAYSYSASSRHALSLGSTRPTSSQYRFSSCLPKTQWQWLAPHVSTSGDLFSSLLSDNVSPFCSQKPSPCSPSPGTRVTRPAVSPSLACRYDIVPRLGYTTPFCAANPQNAYSLEKTAFPCRRLCPTKPQYLARRNSAAS